MSIKLLDCTLRDGGYINQWNFGKENISCLIEESKKAGSDVIELGFLRDVPYDEDIVVFSSMKQAEALLCDDKSERKYAVMCEALNPLPVEKIEEYNGGRIEVIRVIVWKRLLDTGYKYCEELVNKGYQVCIQPNRVEQYSDDEYKDMILRFNKLHPLAFYVVDSFGILDCEEIIHYADIANEHLSENIALGYHGHNNLMQAYGTAQAFISKNYNREIMLDASVYGIGRGAGNLNIELIARYMNINCHKQYDLSRYLSMYENSIKSIRQKETWGYSPYYYLTALHKCNPMYAGFFEKHDELTMTDVSEIIKNISKDDKIRFSIEKAEDYLARWKEAGICVK